MKSTIASIYSVYKPNCRRRANNPRRHRGSPCELKKLPLSTNASFRSLSVAKQPEQLFLRNNARSVELILPSLKSRSPEPIEFLGRELRNSSVSYEADLQKLESLVTRNQSARNGLLDVQTRIMQLKTNAALKSNTHLESIHESDENYKGPRRLLKFPPIKNI